MSVIIPESAQLILAKIKSPSLEQVMYKSFHYGYDSYHQNSHATLINDVAGLENFCKLVYTDWYNHALNNKGELNNNQKRLVKILHKYPQFNPNNVTKHFTSKTPYYDLITQGYDKYFTNTSSRCALLQGGNIISQNGDYSDGFLHVFGFQTQGLQKQKNDCRLYLNLLGKNIPNFATQAYQKCRKRGLPFYFKFCLTDHRNDNFLFYTPYEHLADYVAVIEEIKKEHPELLQGTTKLSQNLGVINGYIGYGDNPQVLDVDGTAHSYNSLREHCVNDIRSAMRKKFNQKFPPIKATTPIITEPEVMSLEDCCNKMITKFIKSNNVHKLSKASLEHIKTTFTYNFYHLVLNGGTMEDIEFTTSKDEEIKISTSSVDWLTEIGKMLPQQFSNSIELRGHLTKFTTFGDNKLTPAQTNLCKLMRETLIIGLQHQKCTNAHDEQLRQYYLSKLNVDFDKLDPTGHALTMISTAVLMEGRQIEIPSQNNAFKFNYMLYPFYRAAVGYNTTNRLITETCAEAKLSANKICFNTETDVALQHLYPVDPVN